MERFQNRADAGWRLSRKLQYLEGRDDVVILAIARGGILVAYEIALSIRAPLDVLFIEKLPAPGCDGLSIGALAPKGIRVLDERLVQGLEVTSRELEDLTATAALEVERETQFSRKLLPHLDLQGKQVVLVDDGVASGLTIHAAVRYLKGLGVAKTVVAVPVIPEYTLADVRADVDAVVYLATPEPFCAVANWYYDFTRPTEGEVAKCLENAEALGARPLQVNGSQDLAL